jgi:predicted RNA-binding Zn-ribbon protein involved in translation (DUF1610 family)
MADPDPWWLISILSYPCPRCGAKAGQRCRTKAGGQTATPHAARGQERRRCRHCQVILPADQDLGDVLCSRCALVRALEVERATHYRRQT